MLLLRRVCLLVGVAERRVLVSVLTPVLVPVLVLVFVLMPVLLLPPAPVTELVWKSFFCRNCIEARDCKLDVRTRFDELHAIQTFDAVDGYNLVASPDYQFWILCNLLNVPVVQQTPFVDIGDTDPLCFIDLQTDQVTRLLDNIDGKLRLPSLILLNQNLFRDEFCPLRPNLGSKCKLLISKKGSVKRFAECGLVHGIANQD
mmetsp:Transcript_7382/g.13691  ORF Transcript_7382/g.13691 Transcript_7382/m.13691 type:complete len:202 (-) Transcript_7382:245-850(-)